MKKLLSILLLGLACAYACAQPRLRVPEIYIGAGGGVTASTVFFSPSVLHMSPIINGARLTGNGGLIFRLNGHKSCGIQIELDYLNRGWREVSPNGTYTRTLHYIEMPFMAHIFFGKYRSRGFINLGPQIGYCVYDDGGTGLHQLGNTHEYDPITKRFDWGVIGGLGGYWRTRKAGTYQMEARCGFSLGGIFGNKTTDYFKQMSSPLELSINLAWLWECKPRNKKHTDNNHK